MKREPVIVVGAGAAGHAFIDHYRQAGGEVDLVLVTREDRLPYFRPLLTKDYLRGEAGDDRLPLDDPGWYGDRAVDLRLACDVEALDVRGNTLRLASGEELGWSTCVLAMGSRPRPLPVAGADHPGVHSVRSAADGDRLLAAARNGGVVVDAQLRASAPDVFAVGDIAFATHEAAGRRLRVEHWGDAETMAEVAAKTLAGTSAAWSSVPGFWSDIGDRTLKLAAWGDGWDEVVVEHDGNGFTAWYGRDGVTVGVLTHQHDDDLDRGSELVGAGAPFTP